MTLELIQLWNQSILFFPFLFSVSVILERLEWKVRGEV